MPTPSDAPGASFPDDPSRRESALGGADAVEKTTYVTGQGTAPESRRAPGDPGPATRNGGGSRVLLGVVLLVVLGGLLYGLAMGGLR